MEAQTQEVTRRQLLIRGGWFTLGAAIVGLPIHALAAELAVLEVAYAGSLSSLIEGPVKTTVARNLKLDLHGRAQGSNALAGLIASGSIRPDVFIAVTPGPMMTVLRAGRAEFAQPFARTEMVIAYSPKSRFAPQFEAVTKGERKWFEVLEEPGLRFGRTDPTADPQGRNIIFTMMLAAKMYKRADLVTKVLGTSINEKQIFTEPSVEARLQSGELDAASAYKIQPGPFNLPYILLPKEINLSGQNLHAEHPDLNLTVNGKTYTPEPLIYYSAVLKDATDAKGATAFAKWLTAAEAQAILRRFGYDPPGTASTLHT